MSDIFPTPKQLREFSLNSQILNEVKDRLVRAAKSGNSYIFFSCPDNTNTDRLYEAIGFLRDKGYTVIELPGDEKPLLEIRW